MGHPDFRVGNRIFATLWPKEGRSVVKLTPADQDALLQLDPNAFSTNSWSHHGWTNVHLKQVSAAQYRDIIRTSWRLVAPKKLVKECDEGPGKAKSRRKAQR